MRLRLRGLAIALLCGGVVGVSAALPPSAAGYGTHEGLGLPPCSFPIRTGYPCPTCGVTTSLSAAAHGRLAEAVKAQPFGVLLLAAAVSLGLAGAAELVSGRNVLRRLRPGMWWLWVGGIALVGGWGLKVAMGLAAGDLPLR